MLQRLFCALYRGHFWLNTRVRDGLWLERTCIHCGKVRRNGQVPKIPLPGPPRLSWSQQMVVGKIEQDRAFRDACAAARKGTLP